MDGVECVEWTDWPAELCRPSNLWDEDDRSITEWLPKLLPVLKG
jgi:hypothetical protein